MRNTSIIFLIITLLFCCACGQTSIDTKKNTVINEKKLYVLALNPSVMQQDGKIISTRNSVAKSLSKDIKNDSVSGVEQSPWQWLVHNGVNNEWNIRKAGKVELWAQVNGSPYAYKFGNKDSSWAAFDISKMNIKGYNDGEINKSGLLFTFGANEEESLCYTAEEDGLYEFSDRDSGKATLVKSVADVTALSLANDKSIVLRVYVNNRIYWQDQITGEKTSVDFPTITNKKLYKGDVIIFSVKVSDYDKDMICGYCDLPASTQVIKEQKKTVNKIAYQTEPEDEKSVPVVFLSECQFTFVGSSEMSSGTQKEVNDFLAKLEKNIGTTVNYTDDNSVYGKYLVLIGDTAFEESKQAIDEIEKRRKNHDGDYIIRYINNKIVIAALNNTSLRFALNFFVENYIKNEDSSIPVDLEYVSADYNRLKNITISGKKITEYKLVVSRFASLMELRAGELLSDDILGYTGERVQIVRDTDKSTGREIIIGDTNRNSKDYSVLSNKNGGNDYSINVSNNNVYVNGDSSAAISAAANKLSSLLAEKQSVDNGFALNGKYNGGYSLNDGYKLTWSDEFNSSKLSDTWISTTRINPSVYGGVSKVVPENSFVRNGNLVQKIIRKGGDVLEADISSKGSKTMLFKYGYLEFRIKMSPIKGSWGAFWAMGQVGGSNVGEIDLFENFGNLYLSKSNLHIWGPGDNHDNLLGGDGSILNYSPGTKSPEPYADNYHIIGLEWEKGYFKFYVDGVCTQEYSYDPNSRFNCFDRPFNLILSHWGGENIDAFVDCKLPLDFTEAEILYDWVRIYQKEDTGSIMYVR